MVSSMTVRPAVYHSAWLRNALLASVALAFMAGAATTGLATPAAAATSKAGVKSKPESKDSAEMPKGPLQIVVSIAHQHVTLYSNGTRVSQTPVSTGMPGRPTPTPYLSACRPGSTR